MNWSLYYPEYEKRMRMIAIATRAAYQRMHHVCEWEIL